MVRPSVRLIMIIRLPSRMSGAGIDKFMGMMFGSNGSLLADAFDVEFSDLHFIEPTGVASLANAVEYAAKRGCPVTFSVPNNQSAPISYLDDSGFFKIYLGYYLNDSATLRSTTAPLQRVSHAESHFWLENRFSMWLSKQLGQPPAALGSVHTCMKEVFNNIDNHSGINVGCTHMQHFPNKNEVVIVVSDFGDGIPTVIRRRFPAKSLDADAIYHASQPGVTSGTTPRNQGAGLAYLIDVIAGTNAGTVHIHSGHGKLACRRLGPSVIRRPWQASTFYPGTMIEIRLNTQRFSPDETERENLEW